MKKVSRVFRGMDIEGFLSYYMDDKLIYKEDPTWEFEYTEVGYNSQNYTKNELEHIQTYLNSFGIKVDIAPLECLDCVVSLGDLPKHSSWYSVDITL